MFNYMLNCENKLLIKHNILNKKVKNKGEKDIH